MLKKLSSPEMKWCAGFTAFVILLTTMPYFIGYAKAGDAWRFTGFVFGVEDGNSYIAKMLMGANGDWLFRTPYTAFAQRGMVAFLPYLLLGKLTSSPGQHEQLVALFHIYRWAGIAAYVISTYTFVALFVNKISLRRWATTVVTLGGGLGWLYALGINGLWRGQLPLEYYSPETFGFLSLFGLPHLAFARAFLLGAIYQYLADEGTKPTWRKGILTGLWLLGVGFMQPLTVVTAWAVIGTHLIFTGILYFSKKTPEIRSYWIRKIRIAIVAVAISSVVVIYNFLAFTLDPALKAWQAQNRIFSPPVGDYLLAFGWALILAIPACIKIVREQKLNAIFLTGWVLIFPLLAYAPYNLQRRLPEGVWVALIILAFLFAEGRTIRAQKWFIPIYIQSFLAAIILLSGSVMSVIQPGMPLFRPENEVKAFEFLANQSDKGKIVLAQFDSSNALPAWAPLRVLTGHGPESIGLDEIQPEIDQFYSSPLDDTEQLSLIKQYSIDYIFEGPDERKSGGMGYSILPYLDLIYSQDGYQIYQVMENKFP